MAGENELDQIRLRKIQAMLDQAKNSGQVNNQPMIVTDDNFHSTVQTHDLLICGFLGSLVWLMPNGRARN
jgi:hypothetical protein